MKALFSWPDPFGNHPGFGQQGPEHCLRSQLDSERLRLFIIYCDTALRVKPLQSGFDLEPCLIFVSSASSPT